MQIKFNDLYESTKISSLTKCNISFESTKHRWKYFESMTKFCCWIVYTKSIVTKCRCVFWKKWFVWTFSFIQTCVWWKKKTEKLSMIYQND